MDAANLESISIDTLQLSPADLTQAARLILDYTSEDPGREGLKRTPERFARAYAHLLEGYGRDIHDAIGEGIFPAEDGAGMVAVRNVEFFSLCEHHLLPLWGSADVRYVPGERILGLSKLPRLVDLFARRLQVQERLTRQIADAVVDAIQPRAVHVRIRARHMCMMMRGVEKQLSDTYTESSRGLRNLRDDARGRLLSESLR